MYQKTFVAQNYNVEETIVNTVRIVFNAQAGYKLHAKYYIQVQLGDTAPHMNPTPQTVYTSPPHPLYSLPNGVKDTIDTTGGVLTKRVKKVCVDG